MRGFDPANILSYGVVGLGFLLAFLAYRLLAMEQNKREPQPATIKAIYVFMAFSFSLTGLGLVSELVRYRFSTPDTSLLKTQYDNELKQRFGSIVNYINRPVLESVRACKRQAEGAASNTGDHGGCIAAAKAAITAGTNAEGQVEDLRKQIQSAIGLANP